MKLTMTIFVNRARLSERLAIQVIEKGNDPQMFIESDQKWWAYAIMSLVEFATRKGQPSK